MKDIDDTLVVRSLSGNADDDDLAELSRTVGASDEAAREFFEIKNIWDAAVSPEIAAGIDTRDSLGNIMERIFKNADTKHDFRHKATNTIIKIAAVLSLPLLASTLYFYFTGKSSDKESGAMAYQEITAQPGSLVHTLLPDSTEIWINGGSSVRYMQTQASPRRVEVEGEVFFKVAKDKEHPFQVHTVSGLDIEAVGTEFNVRSYVTDTLSAVTLSEGCVRLEANSEQTLMEPGQTIIYNSRKKKCSLYLGNAEKMISWRDGNLTFNNEMLKNVYKRLGQIFNVTFEVDTSLENVPFYATFEDASLDQILSLIRKSTPLSYEYVDNGTDHPIRRIKVKAI